MTDIKVASEYMRTFVKLCAETVFLYLEICSLRLPSFPADFRKRYICNTKLLLHFDKY